MGHVRASGTLAIITGPTGVGKDTVIEELKKYWPFKFVVTHTDRAPRPGEINGIHYHFVSTAEFLQLQAQSFFVETVRYGEVWKGTSKQALIPGEHNLVWRIDTSAAASVKDIVLNNYSRDFALELLARTVVIYLTAPPEQINFRQQIRDNSIDATRLEHDKVLWEKHGHMFTNVVSNLHGQIDRTVTQIVEILHDPSRRISV